jgi:hypothetical protein
MQATKQQFSLLVNKSVPLKEIIFTKLVINAWAFFLLTNEWDYYKGLFLGTYNNYVKKHS